MFHLSQIIFVGWAIFWLYWLISAFGTKKNSVPRLQRFVGVRLVMFVLILLLLRISLSHIDSTKSLLVSNRNYFFLSIGFVIFLLGLILAIWARSHLGKNWGMPMSLKQDPELVTTGPYRFIRHPIYTGLLLAILGSSLTNSIDWLIIFVIAGVYFIYSASVEEKIMQAQYPDKYPTYKTKTKMLIPFVL